MTSSLSDLLLDRLEREAKRKDRWPELVLAALEGAAAGDILLSKAQSAKAQPSRLSIIERKSPATER